MSGCQLLILLLNLDHHQVSESEVRLAIDCVAHEMRPGQTLVVPSNSEATRLGLAKLANENSKLWAVVRDATVVLERRAGK